MSSKGQGAAGTADDAQTSSSTPTSNRSYQRKRVGGAPRHKVRPRNPRAVVVDISVTYFPAPAPRAPID